MLCTKCKQSPPFENDTWCLTCSAVEQLGASLASPWHGSPLRGVAHEVILGAVKQTRALREIARSLKCAGDSQAARANRGSATPRSAPVSSVSIKREAPAAKAAAPSEEEEEESEDKELDRQHSCVGASAKSDPARRPAEPPRLTPRPREEHSR